MFPFFVFQAKCHKYWPDVSKVISVDNCVITLETEKDNLYFATRSFKLKEKKVCKKNPKTRIDLINFTNFQSYKNTFLMCNTFE